MAQRKIPEFFKKARGENDLQMRGGLPIALYRDVLDLGSPPTGTRRPLTKVQKSRLLRSRQEQQNLSRGLTRDLEFVAEGLADAHPRAPQRQRQQELHSRILARIAEINDITRLTTSLIENDDEDANYYFAMQQQRKEVADYEARQKQCKEKATPLCQPRPPPAPEAHVPAHQCPMTSQQALALRRGENLPRAEEHGEEGGCRTTGSPLVIPESPNLRQPTPVGSRRAKNRLQRTLTPSVRRSTRSTVSKSSKSSSGSDQVFTSKLSSRNKRLYTAINRKLESDAAAATVAEPNNTMTSPLPPRKTTKRTRATTASTQPQTSLATSTPLTQPQPQPAPEPQPGLQQQTPQQRDRPPRRRQRSADYGVGLEQRLEFHENSRLNRPLSREYSLMCHQQCQQFQDEHFCDHMTLVIEGTVSIRCPENCYFFDSTSRCPHLEAGIDGQFRPIRTYRQPLPPVDTVVALARGPPPAYTPNLPAAEPIAAEEIKEETSEANTEIKQEGHDDAFCKKEEE